MIGALGAARRAVFADTGARHQVEWPRPEPVCRSGQRPHGADLHGVAGEIRLERLARGDTDLLVRTAFQQLDERITSDLIREPGAARTQDAAFTVQQNLGRDIDRFGEGSLDILEAGLRAPVGHRLILQRAFTTLVADRAVQRMVDQQQLHHALLRLVGGLRSELGAHHHARGAGDRAGRHRLALSLDLDQALSTRADGA